MCLDCPAYKLNTHTYTRLSYTNYTRFVYLAPTSDVNPIRPLAKLTNTFVIRCIQLWTAFYFTHSEWE